MKKYVYVIILCVISGAVGIGMGRNFFPETQSGIWKEKASNRQEAASREAKTLKPAKSRLKDKTKCWLCGNDNRSLMGYFRRFDDVGIICTNNWYVLDFKVRNHDEEGNLINGQGGSRSGWVSNGEGECSFQSSQMSDRGISEVTAAYGDESYFDVTKIQGHLCQECLDKVLAVMETYGYGGASAKPRDLCLVDFQTLELYPLQKKNIAYTVRDYYIMVDSREEEAKVHAIYAPVLENGEK